MISIFLPTEKCSSSRMAQKQTCLRFYIAIFEGITCIRKFGKHLSERRCPTFHGCHAIREFHENLVPQKIPAIRYVVMSSGVNN